MFRGKESSNRIELSQLVQELLKFSVLGSMQLWGGGRWVGGVWGYLEAWGCPHMYTHTHACTHMHTHTCIELQMATSMEASMFSMFNMHVHACVHACVCMGHPSTQPYLPPAPSTHLPPPKGGGPPESLKIQ